MSSPLQPQRMKRYTAVPVGAIAPRQPSGARAVQSAEQGLANDIAALVRVAMESRRSFVEARRMVATPAGVMAASQLPAFGAAAKDTGSQPPAEPDLVLDGAIGVASAAAGLADLPGQIEAPAAVAAPGAELAQTGVLAETGVSATSGRTSGRTKSKKPAANPTQDEEHAADEMRDPSEADEIEALVHADEEVDESKLLSDAMDACKIAMKSEQSAPTSQAYKNRIAKYKRLSHEEFNELHRAYTGGDAAAFEKLINHTLLLVVGATRKYIHRNLSFDDLVQEGNMGLMHGITKYDPDLGYRPSGYLLWWINQRMGRAVDRNTGIIRVPEWVHNKVTKLHTNAQRAIASGEENAQQLAKESSDAYQELMRLQVATSLDQTMAASDEDRDLHEFFADDSADVETAVAHRQTMELLMDSLMALDHRTRFIVAAKTDLLADRAHELDLVDWLRENDMFEFMSRYLDGSGYGRSVSHLGEALGRSGERVNQIFRDAMNRISTEMAITAGGKENLSVDITNFDVDTELDRSKRAGATKKTTSRPRKTKDLTASTEGEAAERLNLEAPKPGI